MELRQLLNALFLVDRPELLQKPVDNGHTFGVSLLHADDKLLIIVAVERGGDELSHYGSCLNVEAAVEKAEGEGGEVGSVDHWVFCCDLFTQEICQRAII